jgi:hypothetical protein
LTGWIYFEALSSNNDPKLICKLFFCVLVDFFFSFFLSNYFFFSKHDSIPEQTQALVRQTNGKTIRLCLSSVWEKEVLVGNP